MRSSRLGQYTVKGMAKCMNMYAYNKFGHISGNANMDVSSRNLNSRMNATNGRFQRTHARGPHAECGGHI